MTTNQSDIELCVFDPSLIATLSVGAVKTARDEPDYLLTGIRQLDDHYVMLRDRRVTGIIAATSNGKTSIMNIIERNAIAQLRNENEIVLHITWEDSIEDYGLSYLANVSKISITSLSAGKITTLEWQALMSAAMERAKTPLWAIGHSESGGRRPRLTMTDIWRAMEYIVDKQKKKVRLVGLDYLQRISRADSKTDDMRAGYMGIMDKVKDLALDFSTAVMIGSQVKREVYDRKWRQPQENDAQETSNFEHTCDGIISAQLPKRYMPVGEIISQVKDNVIRVTPNLMMLQTIKQKRGEAPVLRAVDFFPEINEIRDYSPNGY
jgi:replicative DNA helicase